MKEQFKPFILMIGVLSLKDNSLKKHVDNEGNLHITNIGIIDDNKPSS